MNHIDDIISKYTTKLGTQQLWKGTLIIFGLSLGAIPILALIGVIFDVDTSTSGPADIDSLGRIIAVSVIVPIVETLIFQQLPIVLINRFITKSLTIQILGSALFFGVAHSYHPLYIVYATIMGIIFAFGFCSYYHNKKLKYAFISVTIAHMLRNFMAAISIYYE